MGGESVRGSGRDSRACVCVCPSVRLSICECMCASLFLSFCRCASVSERVLVGRVYVEPQNAAQPNESV